MSAFHRRVAATLAVAVAATLISALRLPAPAAAGPSTPLEQTASVPVTAQTMGGRDKDEATLNARTGNQAPGGTTLDGAGAAAASPLSPSANWQVAGHTGSFTWSYPLRVPPAPGGLEPTLSLSYSSSSVDGRTSAANNQASWAGDGWDLSVGFIERLYKPCQDKGDLCWRSDNAMAAFGGGGQLVKEGTGTFWRMESDDGSRIERRTGGDNEDNNGEYWTITTVDGTQYFFGSRRAAASTWTVPVFGDEAGGPCQAIECRQAWRWNLDKVVDTHGNTILYGYEAETNSYGEPAKTYTRGGHLRSAEYGGAGRVDFLTADRCVPGSECTQARKENWPDVPWDAKCDTAACPGRYSPTFWTTKRLAKVTTSVLKGGQPQPVDSWTLEHSFPGSGTGEKPALWLRSIQHTGHVGGTDIRLPAVTFEGVRKANRVLLPDNFAPLNRYRIKAIVSEAGGVIDIEYHRPDCTATSLPTEPHNNTQLCYPVKWTPTGSTQERTDYFHKYVVASVSQLDRMGSGVPHVERYDYFGGAAWHYDTSEFTEDNRRTWNEFRGFARVRVRSGTANDPGGNPVTMSEQRFHRGMDGDTLPGGGKRSVTVDDGVGGVRPDHDWLAGFSYSEATHDGETENVITKTISAPSWQGPTATRGSIKSYILRTGQTRSFVALSSGGWRETKVDTSYDDRGLSLGTKDFGDVSTSADDLCTTVTYVRNNTAWIIDRASTTQTVACGAELLSATRTSYDGQAHGAAPLKGDPTLVEVAKEPGVYQKQTSAEYDPLGRPTKTFDALDRASTMSYSPAAGPVTQTVATNALGHRVTTTYEPAWGVATKSVDANGLVTETAYDALGRVAEVWQPNRPRGAANPTGNVRYGYSIRNDAPSMVATTRIGPNGIPVTTHTLYDGLLRPRQTQSPAAGGGRLLTDTRYDSQGRGYKTFGTFFHDAAVDDKLWIANDTDVPAYTLTTFDGAGRPTVSEFKTPAGTKRTTTVYGGDRVRVTPPPGAPQTTTITDARGQTVELIQAGQSTRYGYTKTGLLSTITDPAGNTWKYHYDLLGRRVKTEDVDKGVSTSTYDNAGQLASTTDARGGTLTYQYDALGRRTALRQGTSVLAEWTYDTALNGVGLPARGIRYHGGKAYVTEVLGYSALGQPTRTQITIPETEQTLFGTYVSTLSYNVDGSLRAETYPAIGDDGLQAETVTHKYDDAGRPLRTYGAYKSSTVEYVLNTEYTRYGEAHRLWLGEGTKRAWLTSYRQLGTRWLERTVVDAEVPAPMQSDTQYQYDAAGNITSIVNEAPGQGVDRQCFQYDEQRRLAEAWTPASDCGAPRSVAGLGGPAPYWQSYSYDLAGNRIADTQRGVSASVTREYTYPAGHRLSSVKTVGASGTKVDGFAYDASGNALAWPGLALEWDAEGRVAKAGDTTFVYAADGARLLRKDPTGVTLYLAGQELRLDAGSGVRKATRYYTHGGKTVGVRTGGGLTWLAGDHQNTAQVAIHADTLQVSRRRFDPFGAPRGEQSAFPGEKGFVGGTKDESTGLTHLGAREYDPSLGRFISVDPIRVPDDPQQLNGYAYANNNPVTYSDPTGLIRTSCPDGECRGGGWAKNKSPASTFNGRFRPPVYWNNHRANAPDGECRFCGRGYGRSPATTFRRNIPAKEPYIPGRCPDGQCSAATKPDWGKRQRWNAYESRERGVIQALDANREAARAREEAAQCGFWCGVGNVASGAWDVITDITNHPVFKWAAVALTVAGMFACPICGALAVAGFAMSFGGTLVSCANGDAGDCAMGMLSLGLGGLGKGIGDAGRQLAQQGRSLREGMAFTQQPGLVSEGLGRSALGYGVAYVGINVEVAGVSVDAASASGVHKPWPGN